MFKNHEFRVKMVKTNNTPDSDPIVVDCGHDFEQLTKLATTVVKQTATVGITVYAVKKVLDTWSTVVINALSK